MVYTDHQPHMHILMQPYLNKLQAWLMEKLGELSLDIKYKEGPLNVLADTLTCQP